MSFFENFAYRRNREVMVINKATDKENALNRSTNQKTKEANQITPNRAHQHATNDVTTIPETPSSQFPTPTKTNRSQERRKQRQKRRAQILSSSEDEIASPGIDNKPMKDRSASRRCKGGLEEKPVRRHSQIESEVRATQESSAGRKMKSPRSNQSHRKSKRLRYQSDEEVEMDRRRSEEEEEEEEDESQCDIRGYLGRRKKRRILNLISDSDDDDVSLEPRTDEIHEEKMLPMGNKDDSYHGNGDETTLSGHRGSKDVVTSGWLSARKRPISAKLEQFAFKKKGRENKTRSKVEVSISESSSSSRSKVEVHSPSPISSISTDTDSLPTASVCIISDDEYPCSRKTSHVLSSDDNLSHTVTDTHDANFTGATPTKAGLSTQPVAPSDGIETESLSVKGFYGRVRPRPTRRRDFVEESEKQFVINSGSDSEMEDCYTPEQKRSVLSFLNDSGLEELCDIPGCSVNKSKMIIQLRPFLDWSSLVDKLTSKKALGEKIIDGCLCLMNERKVMVKLLSKCQGISATIQNHLFRETSCTDIKRPSSMEVKYTSQPATMSSSVQLKPYQLVGLNWLALLHSHNLNGILADEMGLGKTVQAISFLVHLVERGWNGPFLIVVPSSTIENWARELKRWSPDLRVLIYHGSIAERSSYRNEFLSEMCYEVILSTYKITIGQHEDRKFFRRLSLQCIVFDEAHMLKNMSSQRYTHLMRIKAKRRLLLTGTPLQNNLLELTSLLSFVMPEVFQEFSDELKRTFSRKISESSSYYRNQVKQAGQIMEPFILRRLKSEVLKQLPPKVAQTEFCRLTHLQEQLYASAVERSRKNSVGHSNDFSKSLSVITELRKIAMHPLLVRHHYHDKCLREMSRDILKDPAHQSGDPDLIYEDMTVMSDYELHNLCMESKVLSNYALPTDRLGESAKCEYLKIKLAELKSQGSRVLLFSQFTMMLDIMEAFLRLCGHTYLRLDGATPITDRQTLIDRYNSSNEIFIFMLSTKAGGLGINLTAANVVILHDIDFNPYNDKQAEDRCHRVGQTREVRVIRLICKGTVEEHILQCAEVKLKLEQDISKMNADEPHSEDVASILRCGLDIK